MELGIRLLEGKRLALNLIREQKFNQSKPCRIVEADIKKEPP